MTRSARLVALLVFGVLGGSIDAGAQPAADPKAQAKAHEEAGTHFIDVQQYDKAADEYQQAYLLDPQPTYLYASAQAQRLAGDCTKALRSYRAYLRTNPSATDEEKAKKNIDRCEQDLKDHPPIVTPLGIAPAVVTPPIPLDAIVTPPPVRPTGPPWTSDWTGHALVGGGAIAAATGLVLYLGGRATINDNNAAPTYGDFAAGHGNVASAHTREVIGVSAMAVGGALILGGVLHYVAHGSPPATQLSASVAPDHASLVVTRAF